MARGCRLLTPDPEPITELMSQNYYAVHTFPNLLCLKSHYFTDSCYDSFFYHIPFKSVALSLSRPGVTFTLSYQCVGHWVKNDI